MRRPQHDGQTALPVHDSGSSLSLPHDWHLRRKNPQAKTPHSRNARISRSTNWGNVPLPFLLPREKCFQIAGDCTIEHRLFGFAGTVGIRRVHPGGRQQNGCPADIAEVLSLRARVRFKAALHRRHLAIPEPAAAGGSPQLMPRRLRDFPRRRDNLSSLSRQRRPLSEATHSRTTRQLSLIPSNSCRTASRTGAL